MDVSEELAGSTSRRKQRAQGKRVKGLQNLLNPKGLY
jgi:hypothetical protein